MAAPDPQNLGAESAVLGAMLKSDEAVKAVLPILEKEHFYRKSHGVIFEQITELWQKGLPVDAIAVVAALEASKRLVDAGGQTGVHELPTLAGSATQAPHYGTIIRNCWQKRELLNALRGAAAKTLNGSTPDEAFEAAEHNLLEVRLRCDRGRESVVSGYRAAEWFQEKVKNPPTEERGIKVPFSFLRRWQPSRLYVVSGYTADGKTILAAQFAATAASDFAKVGVFTIEMSWQDLTNRIVASFGVPLSECESGRISPEHRASYRKGVAELAHWKIDLIDDEALNISKIIAAQTLAQYDFIVIDHLHQMDFVDRRELERNVTAIANLARRFHIPILLLAQIHRGQNDSFPRPTLSSLRETGVIENVAAMVAFVWRHRDENKLPTDEAEFIVAKNRYGKTGWWPLGFDGSHVRFREPVL